MRYQLFTTSLKLLDLTGVKQTAGSKDVDETFPEALKEPVLRRVQFQTISRVDNLGTFPNTMFIHCH